jgi:hypothetical protein
MIFNYLLVVLVGAGFMRQDHNVRCEQVERNYWAEARKVLYIL